MVIASASTSSGMVSGGTRDAPGFSFILEAGKLPALPVLTAPEVEFFVPGPNKKSRSHKTRPMMKITQLRVSEIGKLIA